MKRYIKILAVKGFLLFFIAMSLPMGCITPRHTVEIKEYVLLPNGKKVLGNEKGLTAFVFENKQSKIPFSQYAALKYGLGKYTEVEYWVTIEGQKFKIMIYDNDELQKYFDTSVFMVTEVETEVNIRGSKANFIGISVIDAANEDCLAEGSLYQNIIITYLRQLKNEYYNS
ncbi:hypothetical protein [Flavobacterium cyanobacteriorum]|uniref:hypothetical protein n=1 Tax=Flavobacterium cyanobacteriorum TaxID=2022802 RepID=UPI00101AE781|nr:hypothetical protein [Flavobacterium cyanobacteriorum]